MRIDGFCVSCAQSCNRAEYIGLIGDRWQTLDIPYTHAVRLEEPPVGLVYMPGADEEETDENGQ